MPLPWSRRPRPTPAATAPSTADTERWRALLDAANDAILLADAQGRVLHANRVAARLFTPPPETASQQPIRLLTDIPSQDLGETYRDAVRHEAPREAEVTLPPPTPRTFHVRITPVSPDEYLVVLRDLTELRRLERVRRDFVANVSHELRTPLTSIKAMAETLLDGARTDESVAPRFLQTIIHESDRLVRLSSDLLDLSRAEDQRVVKSPVDVAGLVEDVVLRVAAQAQKSGITLTNEVRPPLVVPADRDELAQVLLNLLDNAVAYTSAGGTVTVTAQETPQTVTVAVADTGIGIQAQDIPRLFERFYRVDKARSRASGGTGLGLSIVKHIVESHGGTVGVVSEYRKGSTFTFTLPK